MTEDCSICFDTIDVQKTGQVEMSCSHKFHLKCIGTWLSKKSSCPLCRNIPSEMETLLKPEPPIVYGIGRRRLPYYELLNSRTDRLIEYGRFTINIDTSHSDSSSSLLAVNSEQQQTGDQIDHASPLPPDIDGIPGTDIRLVSQQADVTIEQALDALNRHHGDIVNSIMYLTNYS